MNTKISYMYRDADNYKTWNEEVLKGEISAQQLMTIIDCLEDKMYFIPSQVGLPEVRFDDVTEADHCWFELCPEQDFSTTAHEPTIDMTVDKLVERFQAAKGRWDDESLLGIAAERPDEEMEADDCAEKKVQELCEKVKVPHITLSVSKDGKTVNTRYVEFAPISSPFSIQGVYGAVRFRR